MAKCQMKGCESDATGEIQVNFDGFYEDGLTKLEVGPQPVRLCDEHQAVMSKVAEFEP